MSNNKRISWDFSDSPLAKVLRGEIGSIEEVDVPVCPNCGSFDLIDLKHPTICLLECNSCGWIERVDDKRL